MDGKGRKEIVVPSRSQELGTSADRGMHVPFFFCSSLSNTQPAFMFFSVHNCDRFMKTYYKDTPHISLKSKLIHQVITWFSKGFTVAPLIGASLVHLYEDLVFGE